MNDEVGFVTTLEAECAVEGSIGLEFGPAITLRLVRFVVARPEQLHGITLACAEDLTGDVHEGKCLFDPFTNALADGIAGVPGCAPVNRIPAATIVLRHMRFDIQTAQFMDKDTAVVSLVGAERDGLWPLRTRLDQM